MRLRTILLWAVLIMVGLFPFLSIPEEPTGGFGVFLGRFHPLLLHFPIVLLLLVLAVEFVPRIHPNAKWQVAPNIKETLLGITFIATLVTVVGGYLLYRSGEYQGTLVQNHLRGGVVLTLLLGVGMMAMWRHKKSKSKHSKWLFQSTLAISGIILLYTSHVGGSITHGPDFLTEHMPRLGTAAPSSIEEKAPEELLIFQDMIMPALEKRCLSCHNEYKTKGGLLMSSFTALQKGGKSEKPMLVAGSPEQSELFHRINLPKGDEDHMPPSEKPDLTEEESTLIKWWIAQGADPEMKLGQGATDPAMQAAIQNYLPKLYKSERLKARQREQQAELAQELKALGEEIGLVIEPDPESMEGGFAVSMQMPPVAVTDATVNQLLPYADAFTKISLPGSEITDDAFYHFRQMSALQKLYLPKTCVKGDGLIYLQALNNLETINLSNTCLTNAGVLNLTQLPNLKECYIYDTEVSPEVLEALKSHLKKARILEEEGPYY